MSGDLVVMPNTARLVSEFLRDQSELSTLVEERIYTKLPATKAYPLMQVRRIGGSPRIGHVHWLEDVLLQIDAWGGPAEQAFTLAETARAALMQRLAGSHDGDVTAVVTRVTVGGITEDSDDTEPKARPHARFDAVVTVHPLA